VTKARVLLAGLLVALSVHVPDASAATKTVHLTNDGPRPSSLTIAPGDRVVFVNDDRAPHQVQSQEGWQYDSGPLPPGQTSEPTPALTAAGSYRYSDLRGIVVLPQTFGGRLVVPEPGPSPTPSPSPRPSPPSSPPPSPEPTTPPTPAPTTSPSPSASPTASPASPLPTPTTSATPAPVPTPAPDPRYGDPRALVQPSPHRYGLPALVAGILIGGVLSLLARYLLSLPEGRRTGSP
jgi:plastocyanin